MRLTDFSIATKDDYDWMKEQVDTSMSESFIFDDCELPGTCAPPIATIAINKDVGGYGIYCYDDVKYSGSNPMLYRLFEHKCIPGNDWNALVDICRKFTDDTSTTNNIDIENVCDWENISIPPIKKDNLPISFENLSSEMSRVVIGQPDAIDTICYQVSRFLKKKNPKKPLSLLAYGPPGIGKSETAKSLAKILSDKSSHSYSAVWTDLNTFTEAHTVYRLIGSPPGYVGYDDKPVFEAVTNNPYTIFIFDELDKAHPQVLKTFMAILDEGRCASRSELSDGSREFDFKHCIFFFTSNYVLSGDTAEPSRRTIGFSLSDDVNEITFDDESVQVDYSDNCTARNTDESLTQKIYKSTERARRKFIECGVLAEIASRFHGFVEYKPLDEAAKAKILAKQIIETGFEYGIRIGYISKDIMQGIINEIASENSLTVRSFKAVIEGRLVDAFSNADTDSQDIYRIEGLINNPVLTKI